MSSNERLIEAKSKQTGNQVHGNDHLRVCAHCFSAENTGEPNERDKIDNTGKSGGSEHPRDAATERRRQGFAGRCHDVNESHGHWR
jgi:hypothetical protein